MSDLTFFDGETLRDRGMALADAAEGPTWREVADHAIQLLAETGQPFTAEDVRVYAGDPEHHNAMGARFNAAARAGLIRSIGWRKAERASRHVNQLRVWQGVA